jgi:hypothetical protein
MNDKASVHLMVLSSHRDARQVCKIFYKQSNCQVL